MRVLSGITPSGECHLGNYFGAMRQHIELQEGNEAIYFMADYHSMNSVRDAAERRRLVQEIALIVQCLQFGAQMLVECVWTGRQARIVEMHQLPMAAFFHVYRCAWL